jgi:hypothetical protein
MSAHSQADVPAVAQEHEQILDAEVVAEPISLELARRERRSEVIKPLDATQLVESFAAYQELLPQLLVDSDYQGAGDERFVKKSGWRKIATAFDLDVKLAHVKIERDDAGAPIRAEVWARAVTPAGRSMDADGYCSVDEPRFAKPKGRQKLEHDLASTAATRAKNRAIADLVGMGAVSAEEVDAGASHSAPEHPWGPPLNDRARAGIASSALQQLVGPMAPDVWNGVKARCGYMPLAIADAYIDLVRALEPEEAAV